eukprot:2698180-Karenia_brevis.AAC.1
MPTRALSCGASTNMFVQILSKESNLHAACFFEVELQLVLRKQTRLKTTAVFEFCAGSLITEADKEEVRQMLDSRVPSADGSLEARWQRWHERMEKT